MKRLLFILFALILFWGCNNSVEPNPPSKITLKPEASVTNIKFIQEFNNDLQKYESVMIGFDIKNCGDIVINRWEAHFKIVTDCGWTYESSKIGFDLELDETTFETFSVCVDGKKVVLVKVTQIELI